MQVSGVRKSWAVDNKALTSDRLVENFYGHGDEFPTPLAHGFVLAAGTYRVVCVYRADMSRRVLHTSPHALSRLTIGHIDIKDELAHLRSERSLHEHFSVFWL